MRHYFWVIEIEKTPDLIQRLAIKGIEDPDYQEGAIFEALDEGVFTAASKSTGYFFAISIPQKVRWLRWLGNVS